MQKEILILGLGNEILTDDGIGPRLVRDIESEINNPNVHFNTASSGGLEIMEYIQGYKKVIIVDAIRTGNGNPGDVYCFTPSDFRETLNLSNLHDINFITALELGKSLNLDLTDDLHIIAVEIIEVMEFNEKFTLPVTEKYSEIQEKVFRLINKLIC